MPGTPGPNLGLVWGWSPHDDGWGVGAFNPGFALLDSLVHLSVLDQLDTPPGSPSNGQRYIVGTSPTGAWAGQAKSIAAYLTTGTPGWTFFTPKVGWRAWNVAAGGYWRFDGSVWALDTIVAGTPYPFAFSAPQTTAYAANQVVGHHRMAAAAAVPANFGTTLGMASQAGGSVAATASTVFSVEKAASASPNTFAQIGTITFAAASVTPTFATAGGAAQTLAQGDVVRIVGPASPDATFVGFYCSLVAARQ